VFEINEYQSVSHGNPSVLSAVEKEAEILSETHLGLRVKCPLFLSDFNQNVMLSGDFE
jgi:hypothetical protein